MEIAGGHWPLGGSHFDGFRIADTRPSQNAGVGWNRLGDVRTAFLPGSGQSSVDCLARIARLGGRAIAEVLLSIWDRRGPRSKPRWIPGFDFAEPPSLRWYGPINGFWGVALLTGPRPFSRSDPRTPQVLWFER